MTSAKRIEKASTCCLPQEYLPTRVLPPLICVLFLIFLSGCEEAELPTVAQWDTFEIELRATTQPNNPYTQVELHAEFISDKNDTLVRPGFWDGDNRYKIRFAPTDSTSIWTWTTYTKDNSIEGLNRQTGKLQSIPNQTKNKLLRHGLLKMSDGKRNVVHHDGFGFLAVGDTPWSLPFRALKNQVEIYAQDRQKKGFNMALLMSVQPDMEAEGPETRNTAQGFMRGFNDLSDGHLNDINPSYYQYLDTLIQILLDHEIVPVYQPVFHGYGWKGKNVLGNHVDPDEYVRYCKYLLARYGSKPAFWLLAGDNHGDDPGVKESGEMMEVWDCYQQPTGLHYNPCDDYVAEWAINSEVKHCEHYNKTHQAEHWLDFQWAQTGHNSEHLYHKVERMYENKPTKAAANGEPTYEGMNNGQNGLGWWQGEEAWMQLMSGGTMGVVYGAACLWQWKITADEEGWPAWTDQPKSWRQALDMEGSNYVGAVSRAFANYDFTDMQKRWDLTDHTHPLLAKEGTLYVSYLNQGGTIAIRDLPPDLTAQWFDPRAGRFSGNATRVADSFTAPSADPWVLIVGNKAL